ncbi:hypothetical protein SAMN05421874_13096, partial [Nonomuraea maritima]
DDADPMDGFHTLMTLSACRRFTKRKLRPVKRASPSGMARRNQHVTDGIRNTVAKQVDSLLWEVGEEGEEPSEEAN